MKFLVAATLCLVASYVNGHGFMKEPPARNSMWRYGFPTPKNYNDNENFCGGAFYQKDKGGKCGVCGDPYGKPQHHADGGKYAKGIIVRNYQPGQVVNVKIILTTAHLGFFQFRLGPKAAGDSMGKLKGYLLQMASGGTKFPVRYNYNVGRKELNVPVKLPPGFTCNKCVLQWWYKGGNNWGCEKGKCGMGKGTQEQFVNCADISIIQK